MEIDLVRFARRAFTLCYVLLFAANSAQLSAQELKGFELALVDLGGKKQVVGTLPPTIFAPRISPDGKRVAFELADPAATSSAVVASSAAPPPSPQVFRVYVADLARLDERRALPLVGSGRNWAPIWSPDGERLVFLVSGDAPDAIWWRRVDGTGEAQKLVDGRAPEGLTANGQQLAFITRGANRDYGVSLLDMQSKAVTLLADQPNSEQHSSRIAPNGRWIAYSSNETGRQEIWIEPLPHDGQRYRMTQSGGRHPLWSPDSKTIYYDQDGQMFSMDVTLTANPPKAADPKGLPIKGFQQGDLRRQFDLTPDGKQFVMLFPLR